MYRILPATLVFACWALTCARPVAGEPPAAEAKAAIDGKAAEKPSREPDVIFVPTPQEVVEAMLKLANVTKDDLVYDLGCGDGRIVVTAARKYGCRAVGFDVDAERIRESKENVAENQVGHLVEIKQEDIFKLDLSKADVVTLYLLPSLNVKLIPQLEKLKPGSRIVSHAFDMRGVVPDRIVRLKLDDGDLKRSFKIYLWTTPLKKEKKKAAERRGGSHGPTGRAG